MMVYGGSVGSRGGVNHGSGVGELSHGSGGVGQRSVYGGGSVCYRCSDLGNVIERLFAHNCVEAIVVVSCVVNSALGTVWVNDRVRSVNDVTVAALVLCLGVTGETVVYIVRKGVLRVGVSVCFDSLDLGGDGDGSSVGHGTGVGDMCGRSRVHNRCSGVCDRRRMSGVRQGGDQSCLNGGDGANQYYQLWNRITLVKQFKTEIYVRIYKT